MPGCASVSEGGKNLAHSNVALKGNCGLSLYSEIFALTEMIAIILRTSFGELPIQRQSK